MSQDLLDLSEDDLRTKIKRKMLDDLSSYLDESDKKLIENIEYFDDPDQLKLDL